MSKSINELLATPSTSRRKFDATFIKSSYRSIIPNHVSTGVNDEIIKRSNQLADIGLTESMWETYDVNALYNFSYERLKRYERILKLQIKNDVSCMESDSPFKSQQLIVKVQHFPEMVYSERDNPPIKITVVAEDEEGCEEPCFTGFLLSVERKIGFMEQERNYAKAIILPLFLINYVDKIFMESVKYFLEDNFSCLVSPLKFSTYDLIFMLFLFSSPEKDKSTSSTVIEYAGVSEEITSIEYAIDPKTITDLWKQITEQCDSEEVSEAQVFEFITILEKHFYKMFSINLSCLELQVIKTPLARVQANHSVVVSKSQKLYFVLRYITHLAQELF